MARIEWDGQLFKLVVFTANSREISSWCERRFLFLLFIAAGTALSMLRTSSVVADLDNLKYATCLTK